LDIKATALEYSLPEGFSIISQDVDYDLKQYASVLWNGFGHAEEGPVDVSDKALAEQAYMLSGPHNNLSLKIAVKNPEGDYVSYAALWYNEGQDFCTIEPCATHPDYRRMGLGKAAIYEGISRCKKLGAKYCLVGSDQDFYYRIGFAPAIHCTYWKKR
jgi:GNAT superfamily N-acetyltransferase